MPGLARGCIKHSRPIELRESISQQYQHLLTLLGGGNGYEMHVALQGTLMGVHRPAQTARPIKKCRRGLLRPDADARQAVHPLAMFGENVARLDSDGAGEGEFASHREFTHAASAGLAVRIGEMHHVAIEKLLQIGLIVDHLAARVLRFERR